MGRKYWTGGREVGRSGERKERRKEGGRKEGRQARQGGREEGWREDRPLFLLGQDPHGDLSGPAQGLTHQRRLMKHWLKERTSGPPGGEALRTKHSGY